MQDLGGVGGLLAMRFGAAGPLYHPTYDGNDNITEYPFCWCRQVRMATAHIDCCIIKGTYHAAA